MKMKMKMNKKVRNNSAIIKETNVKNMTDNFKTEPEELVLATDHVTYQKCVLPDAVKAFNHYAKIKAIMIELKLCMDIEKVKKNKSKEALQKHLELLSKTQKNVTIVRKVNGF